MLAEQAAKGQFNYCMMQFCSPVNDMGVPVANLNKKRDYTEECGGTNAGSEWTEDDRQFIKL